MTKRQILFPVGRLVQGSLYKGNTSDRKGVPYVVKTGPRAGQPVTKFYFAVAIAKTPGHTHWSQTEWGQQVLQAGAEGWPQHYQHPTAFSWKIDDGDSTAPNLEMKRPCDNEGWPGHWIIKFNGSNQAPRVCQRDAQGRTVDLLAEGAVKTGYYVQVAGDCVDNKPSDKPGVYMNYQAVMFSGVGQEIFTGVDLNTVFGAAAPALPPGATTVPVGVTAAPVLAASAAVAPLAAPTVVAPNAAFLAIPAAGAAPALAAPLPVSAPVPVPQVPAPAVPAGPTPTTKLLGIGHTVASMMQNGWTLDMLRQEQYIV